MEPCLTLSPSRTIVVRHHVDHIQKCIDSPAEEITDDCLPPPTLPKTSVSSTTPSSTSEKTPESSTAPSLTSDSAIETRHLSRVTARPDHYDPSSY